MVLQYIRTQEVQQYQQELKKIYQLPTDTETNTYIDRIHDSFLKTQTHTKDNASSFYVSIEPYVLQDSQLEQWVHTMPLMQGSKKFLWNELQKPITDTNILSMRQRSIFEYAPNTSSLWKTMREIEKDVLWSLYLPPLEKTWPMPLLFPQWFGMRWINRMPRMLELYHMYRIFGAPMSHFIYPLTMFLGPLWYVRTKLKWNVTFTNYIKLLKTVLTELIRVRSGSLKEAIYKITTIVVYVGIYLYGVIQSFDIAHMMYNVRKQLKERLNKIHTFIQTAKSIWDENPTVCENVMKIWNLPSNFSHVPISNTIQGIYSLYCHKPTQQRLRQLLCQMHILHTVNILSDYQKSNSKTVSFPIWSRDKPTKMYGMGHPCLPKTQQRNPLLLEKSLIMTGPNAAGKTTYVRSILANYILAQSFGICIAKKSWIQPVYIISSFMRVQDVIGSKSLYEAECQRCKELIEKTTQTDPKQPVLLFLDEPMHATPPIEGASTAMAMAKYLGQQSNVTLIITTHYHVLSQLEIMNPKQFRNISMSAHVSPSSIQFDYKLRSGPSYQSIAIEMLEKDAFPESMRMDAIEIKNKICRVENK